MCAYTLSDWNNNIKLHADGDGAESTLARALWSILRTRRGKKIRRVLEKKKN